MHSITDKAEQALARAEALGEERHRIFIELDAARILERARALDALDADEARALPLFGRLISLKDLVDEAGQRTTAGSQILQKREPASANAAVVDRLLAAGAVPFGRTNMTEFAYSGVGLNPHHGTPGAIHDRAVIPGGSSSGAAMSVARGICDAAICTDTGGSARIPAAINGLYGIKPTAASVSLAGVHPLSTRFDSVGLLAGSLELAMDVLNAIRNEPLPSITTADTPAAPLRFAMAPRQMLSDLAADVAADFDRTLEVILAAGHAVREIDLPEVADAVEGMKMLVSAEARAFYASDMDEIDTRSDPNVVARLHLADDETPESLAKAAAMREKAIEAAGSALAAYDALLSPTIPFAPPRITEVENDFTTWNGRMLSLCSLINLFDGCGVSLPLRRGSETQAATNPESSPATRQAWFGAVMLAGPQGRDERLLRAARRIDRLIATKHFS
ncbi:MAG: glutamyl-tRNA amidotransferase [Gammaproteobacteria bacterium]|nr:MAG: glutamyl-tRNA amidotransferase [Gammaproteobacteria bacterium]